MPEPEDMDHLLRQTLAQENAPSLSPVFQQRLENRLRPRRLSATSGKLLLGYALVGLAGSVWTMHASGLAWYLIGSSVLVPLVTVAMVLRRQRRPQ